MERTMAFRVPPSGNWIYTIIPNLLTIPEGKRLNTIPKFNEIKSGLNGGLLELVPRLNTFYGRNCVAFCDEEGKMKGLPYNMLAQTLWEQSLGRPILEDHLVGPIVIIVGSQSFLEQL
jgi:hypothetical protein